MSANLTRRSFLSGMAAAGVSAAPFASGHAAWAMAPPAMPSGESPEDRGREVFRLFPYGAVTLKDGLLKRQYDRVHASYLALDNDGLLKVYRRQAGMPAPGPEMGGWYGWDGFIPGHSLGQYISGLARIGAATGDEACHRKVRALVEGFAATLGTHNQSVVQPRANLWPCYILDKHFAGLIDAYRLSGVGSAVDLMSRVLQGAAHLLPVRGHDRMGVKNPPYDETYVMPENLFTCWHITGNPAFRDLALRYLLDREFFDPLARKENVLPGRQAYSHAIALSSAAQAYLVLGDQKYLGAIRNAWVFLTTQQQYASGGWGPNELFVEPGQGKLYESLTATENHFETPCGSYAASKLDRYLLRITGEPRYGDHLERLLYNTVLGIKQPDSDGDYPYYSTYSARAVKAWYPQKWPCCSGALVQGVADYVLDLYLRSADGVVINIYASSVLRWRPGRSEVTLIQSTDYPTGSRVSIRVRSSAPQTWTMRFRIPAWLRESPRLWVNRQPASTPATPGSFALLRREWKDGDLVELQMTQPFRAEPIDELHPETVAILRGPVMLVAVNPSPEVGRQPMILPEGFHSLPGDPEVWTHARKESGGRRIVFLPFYRIQNERYTTYFTRA